MSGWGFCCFIDNCSLIYQLIMNTQVKLSFVIPFYNGGKYIRECIESLYLQDIPKNDYEVLIVDDCSSNVDDISLIQALEAFYPTLHIIHN